MQKWTCFDNSGKMMTANGNFLIGTQHEYQWVAEVPIPLHDVPWSKFTAQSHAMLISAAPNMLELLMELHRTMDKDHFYYDRLRDTIGQAMGGV